MFVLNILLALAWAALTGHFTPLNVIVGFALGSAVLWPARQIMRSSNYFVKLPRVIRLVAFFFWELLLANLKVATHVVSPLRHLTPGIVAVPLDLKSDAEIALLANMITLTPGTLSLDVSTDRRVLYVHVIDLDNADQLRREIKTGLERRIQEVFE